MTTTPTPLPRRRAAIAAAALTVATLGTSVVSADTAAAAGKANVKSSISLSKNAESLLGKVSSRTKACTAKTEVSLYWLEPGEKRFALVFQKDTSKKGKWRISNPASKKIPSGKYYVKIAGSKACQPEKSKTIAVR